MVSPLGNRIEYSTNAIYKTVTQRINQTLYTFIPFSFLALETSSLTSYVSFSASIVTDEYTSPNAPYIFTTPHGTIATDTDIENRMMNRRIIQ